MTLDLDATTRRQFRWFVLVALIVLAAGIGLRDPWPSDEPRFTLVAKQMVESGDWLFPHRGRELYSDKPPMLMWLEAAGYELVREWRVAFLLPSLFAGLLTLWCTFDLGRRLWNPRAGLYASILVLATFQFVFQTKRAQIDPLVMGIITLANWGLLRHLLLGPDWRAYWLGCFFAGIGVITKGVGVLALLMLLPYAVARMRGWDVARTSNATPRWLGGAVAFLAAIAIWLVPMLLAAKSRGGAEYAAYVDDILLRQTAKRYADSWAHAQPFWYYLPIVLFNWFPISLAYPAAIPRWRDAWRAREPRVWLPLAWTLLVIVFFSIPRGKRDVYLMPAIPMIALAMAPYLEEWSRARWARLAAFAVALVGGLVVLAAGLWALLAHPPAAQRMVDARGLLDDGRAAWTIVIGVGAAFVACALAFRPARGIQALLAGLACLWLAWGFFAYPVLNDSSSARGIMRRAGELIGPDSELGLVAWKEQNLLLADRPAADFGFKAPWNKQYVEAVAWLAEKPDSRWVFSRDDAIDTCVDRAKATRVGVANRREWWVFKHDAVIAGCEPDAGGQHEAAAEKKDDAAM